MAVLKSAGAKGGEIAAKALAGLLYDTSCKDRNISDPATGYICKILGSVSGKTEDAWKEKVTEQLSAISSKLDTIQSTQLAIQRELQTEHKLNEARFNQVSANVVAGTHLVRVEGLWEKFRAQFDKIDADVTRDAMISFAKEIMKSQPHTILADLNVVLTTPVLDGQPLVRYPFYEWRLKNENRMIHELKGMDVYDFSEKKFAEFRAREEKAYVMYMWAATVLETQCKIDSAHCTKPPRSTADVQADYARYTKQQIAAFNTSVDWFLLNYSITRTGLGGNFLTLPDAREILLRANVLTSATLTNNEGLWGRVISMGDRWDGTLEVSCGGAAQTLKPVLDYKVPVAGTGFPNAGPDSGPLDWWVSSKGNATYDEARFASDWRMFHYNIPTAPTGPCTIAQTQAKSGYLPWVDPSIKVAKVKTPDGREFPFGSFVAIQRAGGSYALLSGSDWSGTTDPEWLQEGPGQREKVVYNWTIDKKALAGPRIGLYMKGRAEYKMSNFSSRIHNRSSIVLSSTKSIRFPDGDTFKLNFVPGNCDQAMCTDPGSSGLMSYNIENNDTESKKGKLDATVALVLRDSKTNTDRQGILNSQGIKIDGSYGKTGDHKEKRVTGNQTAVIKPARTENYRLTYYIYFDLETEGRGVNASDFMYSGAVSTAAIYLTK